MEHYTCDKKTDFGINTQKSPLPSLPKNSIKSAYKDKTQDYPNSWIFHRYGTIQAEDNAKPKLF